MGLGGQGHRLVEEVDGIAIIVVGPATNLQVKIPVSLCDTCTKA